MGTLGNSFGHTFFRGEMRGCQRVQRVEVLVNLMDDHPYPTTGWLGEYLRYTEIQESPTGFHFWTGVVLIASALRRNVFLPWGSIPVFPNHYIILVAPQGRARKSTCISMGRQLVEQVPAVRVLAETSSPEAIVRDLQLQREG